MEVTELTELPDFSV